MLKQETESTLREYKRSRKEDLLYLVPIYQQGRLAAYLRPITFDYEVSMPGIIGALSDWRRGAPYAFNSSFEVTDERTKHWVEEFVLRNDDRIIFVIQDIENHYVGQIGLACFDYEERSAEIDAVARGAKDLLPGIMGAALKTIAEWGRERLGLEHIFLDVFDDNTHAIEFYKKNNFVERERIALTQEKNGTESKWKIDEGADPDLAPRRYMKMELMF